MAISLAETNSGSKIIDSLREGENLYVSAIPGMGLNTLSKDLHEKLRTNLNNILINIYPHEENSKKEKLILTKIKIENEIFDHDQFENILNFTEYLKRENKRLIIFIHKIYQFEKPIELINFLLSLRSSSNKNISLYVDNLLGKDDIIFNPKLNNHSFNRIVFKGIENFDNELLSNFYTQIKIKPLNKENVTNILRLTAGHIGLIIDLLKYIKISDSANPTIHELVEFSPITNRLNIISNNLFENGISTKDILESDSEKMHSVGITFEGYSMILLQEFIKRNKGLSELIRDNLTETEFRIFTYLNTNKNNPKNIDDILSHLGNNFFEEKTNWVIYKHISNINRKIAQFSLRIKGHRNKGYLLFKIN